jgi:hypothetical protein
MPYRESPEGYADGVHVDCTITFSWWDRLRILFGGKVLVKKRWGHCFFGLVARKRVRGVRRVVLSFQRVAARRGGKVKVYIFEVGHYRGLWDGPVGVVVAKDKKDAEGQLEGLCGSDEMIRQLKLVGTSRHGIHKIKRKGRE